MIYSLVFSSCVESTEVTTCGLQGSRVVAIGCNSPIKLNLCHPYKASGLSLRQCWTCSGSLPTGSPAPRAHRRIWFSVRHALGWLLDRGWFPNIHNRWLEVLIESQLFKAQEHCSNAGGRDQDVASASESDSPNSRICSASDQAYPK